MRAVKGTWDAARVTRGAESLAVALSGTRSTTSIERLLVNVKTNPNLATDPDVLYFLTAAGSGDVLLTTSAPKALNTITRGMESQAALVEDLRRLVGVDAGKTDQAAVTRLTGTCENGVCPPGLNKIQVVIEVSGNGLVGAPPVANPLNRWITSLVEPVTGNPSRAGHGTIVSETPVRIPGTVTPQAQKKTLEAILAHPGKVILLDLDLTTLMPVERTARALRVIGDKYGIVEFSDPRLLPMLPGYTKTSFPKILDERFIPVLTWHPSGQPYMSLREAYPNVDWDALWEDFNREFWAGDLTSDQVTPGLAEFLQRARAQGKVPIFMSGRGGHDLPLADWRTQTIRSLEAGGIEDPILYIGKIPGMTDGQVKASRMEEIKRLYGDIAAVVDERGVNRAAMLGLAGEDAIDVPIRIPGFTNERSLPSVSQSPYRLSTFEMIP